MDDLLSCNWDLNQSIKRNIVSLRISEDLFDDLSEGDDELSNLARELESEVKKDISPTITDRAFHYTTAIEYPFTHEPYLNTRFGDGTYPVWYGAMSLETTIHETAYHMMRSELSIEGLDEIVFRERAVYDIHCRALLINLSGKEAQYPDLITDDYSFTQQLANRLQREGHPGLIAPSARHQNGENVIAFRKEILSNARLLCYLSYAFDPHTRNVTIERQPGDVIATVNF